MTVTDEDKALAETLAGALEGANAWLDNWAAHVGSCGGGGFCICGLTFSRSDTRQALTSYKEQRDA